MADEKLGLEDLKDAVASLMYLYLFTLLISMKMINLLRLPH